ncbi:hypothetical protein OEA41_007496 [Lepraria neglecta]|uniref:Uncharacterized protein n=1 Tax=Lepraria neglecta TaxID=209136 RepID=A0AAE0DN03_9LECA|nr:hypothetical protein OEA41_007496 [Lepraria neglecta]
MGNLCGKPSKPDPFSQPGRTVGSAPTPSSTLRATIPKTTGQGQGQGQTLGGSNAASGDRDEARRAAARAAEERAAKANQPKGKLERDLAKQKAQTRVGTLENISQDERRRRDADQTAQAVSYN